MNYSGQKKIYITKKMSLQKPRLLRWQVGPTSPRRFVGHGCQCLTVECLIVMQIHTRIIDNDDDTMAGRRGRERVGILRYGRKGSPESTDGTRSTWPATSRLVRLFLEPEPNFYRNPLILPDQLADPCLVERAFRAVDSTSELVSTTPQVVK
jgi:hypothetical protein